MGVSQTLCRWTEGATYVRQGDHHVGHWPTFYFKLRFYVLVDTNMHWSQLFIYRPSAAARQVPPGADSPLSLLHCFPPAEHHRSLASTPFPCLWVYKAHLAWMAGYTLRWFACPETIKHPSTNYARRRVTSIMCPMPLTDTVHQTATNDFYNWTPQLKYVYKNLRPTQSSSCKCH